MGHNSRRRLHLSHRCVNSWWPLASLFQATHSSGSHTTGGPACKCKRCRCEAARDLRSRHWERRMHSHIKQKNRLNICWNYRPHMKGQIPRPLKKWAHVDRRSRLSAKLYILFNWASVPVDICARLRHTDILNICGSWSWQERPSEPR